MLRFLKIAAYLNFAAAAIYLFANLHFPFVFLLASAVFFIDGIERGKRYFKSKKLTILIIAIVSIIFNPISAIFTFIAYSKIDEKEKKVNKTFIDKISETEKLDLLIKIGVGMLLLAGIIFAITVWEYMPNYWKLITLLLIAACFFLLSNYSEKNLKLENTTILYWNLGIFFIILGFISVGLFSLFGHEFSFFGEGSHLLQFFIFLVLAVLANLSYQLYEKIEYKFIYFISSLLIINSILAFVNMELAFRLILLILITITIALYEKKADYYNKFCEFAAIFIFPGLFLLLAAPLGKDATYIPYVILTIGFMIFYTKTKPEESYLNFFTPFVSLIILALAVGIFPYYNWQFFPYILTSIFTLAYGVILFLPFKLILKRYFLFLINIVYAFVFFDMITNLSFTGEYDIRLKFGIAMMVLFTSILSTLFDKKSVVLFEKILQPLKIIAFVVIGYIYLLTFDWYDSYLYLGHLLYTVMLAMLILSKNKLTKRIYYLCFYSIFLVMLVNSIFFTSVPIVLLVAAATALLYTYLVEDEFKDKLLFLAYFVFVISAYVQIVLNDVVMVGVTMSAFITLFLFSTLMIATRKYNPYFIITTFLTLLPVHAIIYVNAQTTEIYLVLSNLLCFYGLYLLNQLVFVERRSRLILTPLLASFIILTVLFTPTTLIGIYMVLIGLILIVFGYKTEDYNSLFYLGVGTIVINILYQLRVYWPVIPIWIYLMFAGILIITFATYLEVKKVPKK